MNDNYDPQLDPQQTPGEVPPPAPLPDEAPYDPELDGPEPEPQGQPAVDGQQAASGQPVTNQGQRQAEAQSGEMIGATGDAQGDNTLEKDPSDWVSGDDPMTESQKSYLDTLAKQAGEQLPANMTKAEASQHIDRLKGITGM